LATVPELASPRLRTAGLTLAAALSLPALAACSEPSAGPPLAEPDLGPSLDAGRGDPLLLSFAAARARSRYLVDQGYTLAWDGDDVPSFTTDDAGDLGVVLEADGELYVSEDDLLAPVTVTHTASDSAVLHLQIDPLLSADLWFVVGSSGVATLDVRVTSAAVYPRQLSVIPWLRRCAGSFEGVATSADGLAARHTSVPDPRLADAGPGTFVTDLADALEGDEAPVAVLGAAACGPSARDDLGVMIDLASPPPATAATLALQFDRDLAPLSSVEIPVHRAVADAAQPGAIAVEIAAEKALVLEDVLTAGQARLAAAPPPAGLSAGDALVYHSSLALVDQVTMPAEGLLAHDYYVFSRAPGFWFARLGDRPHESLAMILLARLDPGEAGEIQRNFIDAVGSGGPAGYLPYRIGPVIQQTGPTTAAAPLFSFESWEIAQLAGDASFLADAYAAGQQVHAFWVAERDQDHDGLAEWGSVTESVRDQDDVIWTQVAPPGAVDAVDLNCMLVVEEQSLAKMAAALGQAGEAAAWQAAAAARAALINALMWDDATGFYYDVSLATHTFTYQTEGDLERMEIAGFLPLWAGIVPGDRLATLTARLADPAVFLRPYGVASLAATDPFYAPGATGSDLWNGPVSVPWQWLVVRGLRASGQTALADQIMLQVRAAVTAELQRSHVFRELYDPDDAAPANASGPNYLWSSMTALMALEAGAP
jgi:hypothetical protein